MEGPDLVRRERPNDRVQNTSVVEEHEILFRPIVRVDQLRLTPYIQRDDTEGCGGSHLGIYRGALHPVEDVPNLLQISDVGTIWVEGPVP